MSEETIFEGFVRPTKNFFPMPNEWINICAQITNLAELKVVQYVLRHTWGYQEYGITKTITVEEFMRGRKRNDGSRIDHGTGLKSDRSVKDGIHNAMKHGYLICEVDATDLARIKKSYALKMSSEPRQVDTTPQDSENRGVVSTPLTGSIYPSEVQNLPLGGTKSTPRTEKDTIERYLGNTPKKESTNDASASTHTQSENVIDFKKATDGRMKAISSSHSQVEYTKEEDEPTAKLPAVKGTSDGDTHNSPVRDVPAHGAGGGSDSRQALRDGTAETPEALGRLAQKLGAGGAHFSPADTPPGVSTGDATSRQAPSSNAGTLLPAQHNGFPPGTSTSADAAQAIPKRPRKPRPPTMPEPKPPITLTAQEQAFWDLWLAVWFNIDIPPRITETAHSHVVELAPHIKTEEQLKSLIEHTRKELQEAQGIKRKMVHLGNLVNSYPGWKQSQPPPKEPRKEGEVELGVSGLPKLRVDRRFAS